jgi:Ca2+/Na+ antiporter
MILKRKGVRRVYTEKAWIFRKYFKGFLIFLFSPILIPVRIIMYIYMVSEIIDDKIDDLLEFIVDNLTPSFRKR